MLEWGEGVIAIWSLIQLALYSIRWKNRCPSLLVPWFEFWAEVKAKLDTIEQCSADLLVWQKGEISECFRKQKVQPWDGNSEWQPMINMKRSPWPAETISSDRANVAQSMDELLVSFFSILVNVSLEKNENCVQLKSLKVLLVSFLYPLVSGMSHLWMCILRFVYFYSHQFIV